MEARFVLVLRVLAAGSVVSVAGCGCGPSDDGPEPDWFMGTWFLWDDGFGAEPDFSYHSYVDALTLQEGGSAMLAQDRVCGLESVPQELVWEEDDVGAILLRAATPGETFQWVGGTVQTARFVHQGDCQAKAELVDIQPADPTENFDTLWHAGEVAIERFTWMDCYGTVVATTDDPCTRDFPRGFPSTDD